MFAPVYVILRVADVPPAEAIRASLAPFQRGGRGDVPDAWLSFHDETDHVRTLHGTEFVFTVERGGGTRIEGGPLGYLDIQMVKAEMVSRLGEDAAAGRDSAFPGAVLLPPGAVEDRLRWLRAWPRIDPVETVRWLGLADGAAWEDVVSAAYRRFSGHWAAGVAYHL